MPLSPEQVKAVASWVAAGDNLAVIQSRLSEQFKISMTYMDVRFLIDDLGLEMKSAAKPTGEAGVDLSGGRPGAAALPAKKGGLLDKLKKAVGAGGDESGEADDQDLVEEEPAMEEEPAGDFAAAPPAGPGGVKVELDRVMRPGAVVSGSVTFSDGTAGKWALDQYGRLMLETGRKDYHPPADDVQAFQRELSIQLQRHGF